MLKKQKIQSVIDKKTVESLRIAIVRTDYHKELNDNLEEYCIKTLLLNHVKRQNIQTFSAPGSWEIPLIAQAAAKSGKFDGIVTFGVIVKGDTHHFDMIANECARALMNISIEYSIPVAIEVLAVFDIADARARAGRNDNNKGIEGALAVLKALSVLKKI